MSPDPIPIVVMASGGGSNFQALVDWSRSRPASYTVAGLIASSETAGVVQRAEAAGIPWDCPPGGGQAGWREGEGDRRSERLLRMLEDLGAVYVVLAGYLQLIPSRVVRNYWGCMVNIHPALLPSFGGKGMYGSRVHEAVLREGVSVTGVTVHFVDGTYDTGPIIAQRPVPVVPGDNASQIAARVLRIEHQLLPRVVNALACGDVKMAQSGKTEWRPGVTWPQGWFDGGSNQKEEER